MVIGSQTGSTKAGEEVFKEPFMKPGIEKPVFRHGEETFRQMWQEVSHSTGVKMEIWVEYRPRYELGEVDEEKRTQNEHFFQKLNMTDGRRISFSYSFSSECHAKVSTRF